MTQTTRTTTSCRCRRGPIGRFISLDPVFQLNDPLQWNGYAYSANNPVTWSDPTGLSLWNSIKHAASSASKWTKQHQAAIAGFAVGFIAGAACTALTGGSLALVCGAIGGALAGAVTNLWKSKVQHTQQFSWASLASDIAIGAAAGAVGGQLGKLATKAVAAVAGRAGPALAKAAAAATGKIASAAKPALNRAGSSVTRDAVPNLVYRGLAAGEDPAAGLVARAPEAAGVSPISHVAGKSQSPWISTTKSVDIATEKYGQNGVVAIDLNKVSSEVVDVSEGFANGGRMSAWAKADQEVLIRGPVPPEAIVGSWP